MVAYFGAEKKFETAAEEVDGFHAVTEENERGPKISEIIHYNKGAYTSRGSHMETGSGSIQVLMDLVHLKKPSVILLFEIMIPNNKVEIIRTKLGYEGLFTVDRNGHGGGIAILWKIKDMIQLLSYSDNHINVLVHLRDVDSWRLTGFYGFLERCKRCQSWDLIRSLYKQSSLPWCCIGDFNDLLNPSEKRGSIEHPQWLLSGFRTAIDDCYLWDLGICGYPFTWERGRGTENWVEERLDRAFASQTWLALFPNCRV
ncbi:hypothetical protein DH2020_022084 [Rehmannia glutinosa]|uniref:Endonuclease/exonuclease/phosphatase domain-containing protein n=1 Tax=Rehmannia glutinosa TaxID=99300 RepID=A0ABR0WGR7_REHGL